MTGSPEGRELDDPEGRMRILEWRTAGSAPQAQTEAAEGDGLAPRRSKSKRRKELQDVEFTAASALEQPTERPQRHKRDEKRAEPVEEVVAEQPVVPEVPKRVPLPRSEEFAQVGAVRGQPTLLRNKRVIAPLMFHAPMLGGMSSQVRDEVRMAAEHGIHLYSVPVPVMVGTQNASSLTESIEGFLSELAKEDPSAQVVLRFDFAGGPGWQEKFPAAGSSGRNAPIQPSVCDDEFWSEASSLLERVVASLRNGAHNGVFLGVHLDRDGWSLAPENGYDTSSAATAKFRTWLRHRYRDDAFSLRAAWFDGSADFGTVEIPGFDASLSNDGFVRTDRRARRWIDYHLFIADATVERIGELCYAAKKAAEGDLLTGASYGHILEWSHPYSGHLSLGKLLRCPDLDYISGPPSYSGREPGESAAFPFPVDSCTLNGKLFISEEDFRTPISGRGESDNLVPLMRTPQALESAHWRGAGAALAHGGGVCWMDTNGSGWLTSRGIWERAKQIHDMFVKRLASKPDSPEVAVFIDERSLGYLTDPKAFESVVRQTRECLLRSGLTVGFYLLSDLAHRESFPDCKLYVFVNAWDMRPEVKSAIKSRLQTKGKVLFWLYAAGLFEAGRESLERVREVTGIALRPQPFNSQSGTTILNTRDPLSQQLPEAALAAGGDLEPSYFAIPEDAQVLGEYTQTGLPSFVVRKFKGDRPDGHWTSVFLGEPVVSPGFFRVLAQMAGGHVWSFENDLAHVTAPFAMVHCAGSGPRSLMLPNKWAAYSLEENEYLPVDNNSVRFRAVDGSSHPFVVGPLGDVQAIVNADPEVLSQVKEPILHEENTLHWENLKFDVAIMKLDEWMEEAWSDEMADDLLLKPSLIEADVALAEEEAADSPDESPGRRRRRRRRRGSKDGYGSEESANFRREGADRESVKSEDIGFLFRKRE